ncbi:MAG: Arm DNA-binding domain-containing protein [Deltaproteobacteria bacterium]|jgi:hypothetical protein|nr:Arm DNA-binding domain-containing protein [Deltaproteobacteria bacterium]
MKVVLPLTELKIRNLKPKDRRYKIFDGGMSGLYLETLPSGTKSWRIQHGSKKNECRHSLGHWPDVSLKEARDLAADFRKRLKEPPPDIDKEDVTIAGLCGEWKAQFYPSMARATVIKRDMFFDRHILPRIGHVPVNSVTPAMIYSVVLKPLEDERLMETAHRVKSSLSQLFPPVQLETARLPEPEPELA